MISLSWPIPACRHVPYLGIRSREIWSETEWSGPKQGALKMGFLKNFSEPFAFALALWPFVSMLLTVTREQRMKLPWQSAPQVPGATNFVTGLYTAFIDSMPVLCVVGQANANQLKQEPFQCVDMPDIVKTVTKKAWSVLKAEDIVDVMKEAFYLMREGRPGPVLVELPLDVQKAELDFGY